ncbi:MAG: hypothetical protein ABW025_03275, partial [Cellulomonas sp.]
MTDPTPTPATDPASWTLLRRDGVAVVLAHPRDGLPEVQHWGADLGPLALADLAGLRAAADRQTPPGTLDAAGHPSLLPQDTDGWPGRPGLQLVRGGVPLTPRWRAEPAAAAEDGHAVEVVARDPPPRQGVRSRLHQEPRGRLGVDPPREVAPD